MGVSMKTKRALRKAEKKKNRRRRGNWLFIQRGDSIVECFSKLFTQFAALVLIACCLVFANEARLSISARNLNNNLKALYHTYLPDVPDISPAEIFNFGGSDDTPRRQEILPGAQKLLELNPDTIGYIAIDDTNISMPVVQRKGTDGNAYYLTTAFDGSNNKAGTVFLDYRAKLTDTERSDVLTVYGHNQRDGTMFGDLKKYKHDVEFYRTHPTITFSSNYRADTYKIFAYFVTEVEPSQTKDGNVFMYHNFINLNKQKYNEFISNIELRSQITTSVDVQYGDEFLVLSTCSNEFEPSRFVVFARKTRDGEDAYVDTSAAAINPGAKEPDWDVIYHR